MLVIVGCIWWKPVSTSAISVLIGGFGEFAIGARVALLWQHNAKPSYKLASIPRYDDIVRTLSGVARASGRRRGHSEHYCGGLDCGHPLVMSWQQNANAKCSRVHACTRSMPGYNCVFSIWFSLDVTLLLVDTVFPYKLRTTSFHFWLCSTLQCDGSVKVEFLVRNWNWKVIFVRIFVVGILFT